MKRQRSRIALLFLGAVLVLAGCAKKGQDTRNRYDADNGAYSISVPAGWTTILRDRVNMKVLTITSDTTATEGTVPEIVVISDDNRRPLSFTNVARDAVFKMAIIRKSSRQFSLLDSSRIKVDGREGVVYTYKREPKYARTDIAPRQVVMVFLQTTQGMVNIKYIAPAPVSEATRKMFERNLESVKLRDIEPEMTEEEFQELRKQHQSTFEVQPGKRNPNRPSPSMMDALKDRKGRQESGQ